MTKDELIDKLQEMNADGNVDVLIEFKGTLYEINNVKHVPESDENEETIIIL